MDIFTPNPANAPVEGFLHNKLLNPDYWFPKEVNFLTKLFQGIFSDTTKEILHSLIFYFTLFFITIICYVAVRMFEIRKKEHAHLHHEIEEFAHTQREIEKKLQDEKSMSKNERWIKVLNYLFSHSSSDWKLAIMEADSMLLDFMGQMGFPGDTLGDRLKAADQDTFPPLTRAWEVHSVRNRIAHEGLSFELTQQEAKRIIAIYESIFHPYGYI
jgi:hypothetical protein